MSSPWSSFPRQSLLVENWRRYLKEGDGAGVDIVAAEETLREDLPELIQALEIEPTEELTEAIGYGISWPTWWHVVKETSRDASKMALLREKRPGLADKLHRTVVAMEKMEEGWAKAEKDFLEELNSSKLSKASVRFILFALKKKMTHWGFQLLADPKGYVAGWTARLFAMMALVTADTLYKVFGNRSQQQIQDYLNGVLEPTQLPPLQLPAPQDLDDLESQLQSRLNKFKHPTPPEDT